MGGRKSQKRRKSVETEKKKPELRQWNPLRQRGFGGQVQLSGGRSWEATKDRDQQKSAVMDQIRMQNLGFLCGKTVEKRKEPEGTREWWSLRGEAGGAM